MISPHNIREQSRAWFVLGLAASLLVALFAGFLYALLGSLSSERAGSKGDVPPRTPGSSAAPSSPVLTSRDPDTVAVAASEDELAERAMVELQPSAARPQPLVTETAGPPIPIPYGTDTRGPVTSGFPQTPAGALAQLAAIDTTALHGLDRQQVQRIHDWAAMPGAVPMKTWTPAVAVEAALVAAGQPDAAAALTSEFTPLAGIVKGSVGDSFVVACVLGEWQITYRSVSRAGAGDCQRMVWADGRWRIGPGSQPSYAPSAWPGSADAVRAGWRSLTHA